MANGAQESETPKGRWLVLEASSAAGSVALLEVQSHADEGSCIARADVVMGASRTDAIFPAVTAILEPFGDLTALRGVVCGAGPGSFTSLRIAASVAKGLAHALRRPLFAVPSLLLAAAAHGKAGTYRVHANALREERYVLDVDIDSRGLATAHGVVSRMTLDALFGTTSTRTLLAVGSAESADHVSHTNDKSSPTVLPDAAALLGVRGWWSAGPVSLDAWEPDYGRLAEAQVKWEIAHDRALPTS